MRVALLTKEFPPEVYGGAGVHVEYLARELARLVDVEVHCFGAPRSSDLVAASYEPWEALAAGSGGGALGALSVDLAMAAGVAGADVVHSHTWYANLGGHLAKLLHGVPHVVTAHSLEPRRPWKADQLGGGYALSSFCERTAVEGADAVVAVSGAMRDDLLAAYPAVDPERVVVVHNGIDPDEYRPAPGADALRRLGVDATRPYALFVGRVSRQKGIAHLLDAAATIDPAAQLVVCAGAPDTPALGAEVRERVARLAASRGNVVWVEEMLPRADVVALMGAAAVFVCPSVYEPFGLINVEAMACATAVVASAVGGIPEVVADGETGTLVPFAPGPAGGTPADPGRFAADLAAATNALLADPARARRCGEAGRRRALERFAWPAVAERTAALYERVLARRRPAAAAVR